eukprot:COSAG06_NODE_4807_length_3937_cov_1.432960_5_plen_68_part_00
MNERTYCRTPAAANQQLVPGMQLVEVQRQSVRDQHHRGGKEWWRPLVAQIENRPIEEKFILGFAHPA